MRETTQVVKRPLTKIKKITGNRKALKSGEKLKNITEVKAKHWDR